MDRIRRQQALDLRIAAAQLANRHASTSATEIAVPREEAFYCAQNYLASFTKGLPHDIHSGLLQNPRHYELLLAALNGKAPTDKALREKKGGALRILDALRNPPRWYADATLRADRERKVPLRHWEGMHAGNEFQLFGPDAQALTIAAAPAFDSAAMTVEMAQLYAMALLRDVPLRHFSDSGIALKFDNEAASDALRQRTQETRQNLTRLSQSSSFNGSSDVFASCSTPLTALQAQSLLREYKPAAGYYLSQFLLCGTADAFSKHAVGDSLAIGGDQRIDQRICHGERKDFATTWNEWLDLQHGADLRMLERLPGAARSNDNLHFIVTPRDLAARVRNTTPQQFFFNACLLMKLHNDEFASYRLTALLAQAASCAIAAARFQQFHVHRRLRPEALAARLEKFDHPDVTTPALSAMHADLVAAHLFDDYGKLPARANRLLPLAWIEGAPMAPSYCSAYAAAAGACATIVKAFFDGDRIIDPANHGADVALVPTDDGRQLLPAPLQQPLTLGGEIDKLAANLAIGRCWAGVSFYSDVAVGLGLGERVAQCLLDEMRLSGGFVTP